MTIRHSEPLTLIEVADLAGDTEKEKKMKNFIKLFAKVDAKKVKEMKNEIKNLGILKIKDEYIVKIIDFMPENAAELTKIVSEVSFDQDEVNKILEIVKKY